MANKKLIVEKLKFQDDASFCQACSKNVQSPCTTNALQGLLKGKSFRNKCPNFIPKDVKDFYLSNKTKKKK